MSLDSAFGVCGVLVRPLNAHLDRTTQLIVATPFTKTLFMQVGDKALVSLFSISISIGDCPPWSNDEYLDGSTSLEILDVPNPLVCSLECANSSVCAAWSLESASGRCLFTPAISETTTPVVSSPGWLWAPRCDSGLVAAQPHTPPQVASHPCMNERLRQINF